MSRRTLDDFKKEFFNDPEAAAAYEKLKPKFELRSKLIQMRMDSGLTQEEIAKRMGTSKASVCRLESAKHSPRLATLQSYAEAAGFKLSLQTTPI